MAKVIHRVKKTEVIEKLSKELGVSKAEAKRVFETVFNTVTEILESKAREVVKTPSDVVSLHTPLGLVKVVMTKERIGVNPKNPSEKIKIPAKRKIRVNKEVK